MGENLDREVAAIKAYAADRGLSYALGDHQSTDDLPAGMRMTGFSSSMVQHVLEGSIPGGEQATLRIQTMETSTPAYSGLTTNYVSITAQQPESIGFVPTLICHPPGSDLDAFVAAGMLGQLPDARQLKTVHFESIKLDRRFDIEVNPRQDENWLYQLFPPTFIDWLAEKAPGDLMFALDRGVMHVGSNELANDAEQLDGMCEVASKVIQRVREECAEEAGLAGTLAARTPLAEARAGERRGFRLPSRPVAGSLAFEFAASALIIGGLAYGIAIYVMSLYGEIDFTLALIPAGLGAVWICLRKARVRRELGQQELQVRLADAPLAHSYAAEHGLRMEDPAAFHARLIGLQLPGAAEYVLSGSLPGAGVDGSLALCADQSVPWKPVNWTVMVTDVPGTGPLVLPAPNRDGLKASSRGRTVAIFARGAPQASSAELDGFLESAGADLARVAGAPR